MVFRTAYNSLNRPFGRLTIDSLTLNKNASNNTGILTLDNVLSTQENVGKFLSDFFAGGGLPLMLDAPAGSENPEVAEALRGLEFSATVNSPGYASFLRNIKFLYYPRGSEFVGAIEIFNSLDVGIDIMAFDLTLSNPSTFAYIGRLKATGTEPIDSGASKVFDLPITESLMVEDMKKMFVGNAGTELVVTGFVELRISGEKAKVNLSVKRLVSMVEQKGGR